MPTLNPRQVVANAKRIVIKLGTNVIMRDDSLVALGRLYSVAESVAHLVRDGRQVILVSSGAIGLGMERLGIKDRPKELAMMQACAAIGQSRLMAIYENAFKNLGCRIAQVLLTEEDFRDEVRYRNLRATLNALLKLGVIPIINENDTVSTMELAQPGSTSSHTRVFGDNDKLSALVMTHIDGNLLVLLSDVDGLYTGDPLAHGSEFIPEVAEITDAIRNYAQGGNGRGRGGMQTKIEAARIASEAGGSAVIANGRTPGIIELVCEGKKAGTLFLPRKRK